MPIKDECGICRRVLSYRYLRKCQRCGRLYCRDCMVIDVITGDPTRLFCLNCARRTVSPMSVAKYEGLSGYLRFRGSFTDLVKLSLARMDGIIGDNLPIEAYRTETWWSNNPSLLHARAWLEAGWNVQEVNLKEGYVVFRKVKEVAPKPRTFAEIKKPFTPVRARYPKRKAPSKTKVSKLYARIKNVERRIASMPIYHGSLKPRPTFEKRLFKTDKKPSGAE